MQRIKISGNCKGTTLLEMMIALIISGLVITGAYRVYNFVSSSSIREKQKAELQRDIITISNLIERDIRMSGCGLPGNGVSTHMINDENLHFSCYMNEQRIETTLTETAQPAHLKVIVADVQGFVVDGYVCLADSCYRRITKIGINNSGPDTLYLEMIINHGPYTTGGKVYGATKLSYTVDKSDPLFPKIRRLKNNVSAPLGGKLDSIVVILKDSTGSPVGASVIDAAVVTVKLGGHVGSGKNRMFLSDSTEVNIRN